MRTEQVSLLLTAPPAAVAPSGQLISKSCFANESIDDEKYTAWHMRSAVKYSLIYLTSPATVAAYSRSVDMQISVFKN